MEQSVKILIERAEKETADNAMKFTQAALNAANVIRVLTDNADVTKRQSK